MLDARRPHISRRESTWRSWASPDRASRRFVGAARIQRARPRRRVGGCRTSGRLLDAGVAVPGGVGPPAPVPGAGALEDNLRLGRPGATAADVARAVQRSGLDGLVARLPEGLDTPVGEGGLSLSAGERQRIALGRAVLRDAPFILLDEPTAHLDARRESSLRELLTPWLEGRTVVMAAHRGGLVGRVDRTVTLIAGRVHRGAHGVDRPLGPHRGGGLPREADRTRAVRRPAPGSGPAYRRPRPSPLPGRDRARHGRSTVHRRSDGLLGRADRQGRPADRRSTRSPSSWRRCRSSPSGAAPPLRRAPGRPTTPPSTSSDGCGSGSSTAWPPGRRPGSAVAERGPAGPGHGRRRHCRISTCGVVAPLAAAFATSVFTIALVARLACRWPAAGRRGLGSRWPHVLHGLDAPTTAGGEVWPGGELRRRRGRTAPRRPGPGRHGPDESYLERALRDHAAVERRARRRSWSDGAVAAVVVLATGTAVVGTLAVATSAIEAHRLPAFMVAVLPLVALGAFEVVMPAADAVSRLADHAEAADRLVSVADLEVPVVDPAIPTRCRMEPASPWRARRSAIGPTGRAPSTGSTSPWRPADGSPSWDRAAPARAVSSTSCCASGAWSRAGRVFGGASLDRLSQDDVRSQIGWVGQDAHLFPTTIGGNIAVARPGATPDEVAAASRDAQLGPWIDSLPLGLDTPVGERGAQLSGGQRQRVALARALLAGAPVLILDEPTSGLDRPTAARLLHDVQAATEGTTVVLITHRDEDLAGLHEVVEVDDGRVVGRYVADAGVRL